jgi:hypothetical protein
LNLTLLYEEEKREEREGDRGDREGEKRGERERRAKEIEGMPIDTSYTSVSRRKRANREE